MAVKCGICGQAASSDAAKICALCGEAVDNHLPETKVVTPLTSPPLPLRPIVKLHGIEIPQRSLVIAAAAAPVIVLITLLLVLL